MSGLTAYALPIHIGSKSHGKWAHIIVIKLTRRRHDLEQPLEVVRQPPLGLRVEAVVEGGVHDLAQLANALQ
jgi:hypothetical protein